MRIVFLGTSDFAAHVLSNLLKNKYNVVAVVTRPDKPQGRNLQLSAPPVKSMLLKTGISMPILQPEKASTLEFAQTLQQYNPDLFLVLAYGEILKEFILKIPKVACVNIHASLLPKYRGAAPIQRCIMDGQSQTGITLIEMVPKMDAGAMIAKKSVLISSEDSFLDVEKKLLDACDALVPDVLNNFDHFYTSRHPQDEAQVTFASKIIPEDLIIDCSKNIFLIQNQIRALSPAPCAYLTIDFQGQIKRLKVRKSQVLSSISLPVGEIVIEDERMLIGCQNGTLSLLEVQLEGKKFMTIKDFILGAAHSKKISLARIS